SMTRCVASRVRVVISPSRSPGGSGTAATKPARASPRTSRATCVSGGPARVTPLTKTIAGRLRPPAGLAAVGGRPARGRRAEGGGAGDSVHGGGEAGRVEGDGEDDQRAPLGDDVCTLDGRDRPQDEQRQRGCSPAETEPAEGHPARTIRAGHAWQCAARCTV